MTQLGCLEIFNNIWKTGNIPKSWKEATVIPIPKPDKDHTDPTNYRPIALTSCICKTMERMINDRLTWFLEANNIITPGFSSRLERGPGAQFSLGTSLTWWAVFVPTGKS